jgi:nucleoside 2-deoxyribosyltransferase
MKIAVCGSITFYNEMQTLAKELKNIGFEEVFLPVKFTQSQHQYKENMSVEESGDRKIALDLIRKHYYKILSSDCILVLNNTKKGISNYIGGNTFLEMGYAFVLGKPIFLLNSIPSVSYESEIRGMQPVIINNDLNEIKTYYQL